MYYNICHLYFGRPARSSVGVVVVVEVVCVSFFSEAEFLSIVTVFIEAGVMGSFTSSTKEFSFTIQEGMYSSALTQYVNYFLQAH